MDLTHKHWAVIIVGILVAILAIIVAWHLFGNDTAMAPSSPTATTTPQATSTVAAATLHLVEHAAYYDIDLAYPSATPLLSVNPAANDKAVATMKAAMQGTADQFKKDGNFANLTHDDVQIMGLDQRKEALEATYKTYTGSRTVSYVFQIYEDTLGAHPNAFYRTFTFDLATGAQLDLSDLFVPGAQYLNTLSNTAALRLPQLLADREQVSVGEVDLEYMRSGISPKPESFQNWYISGRNLVFVFAPYQIGPYALGTMELPLPLSQLTTLKAAYQ